MKAKRIVAVSDSLTPTSMPMTRDCVADIRDEFIFEIGRNRGRLGAKRAKKGISYGAPRQAWLNL